MATLGWTPVGDPTSRLIGAIDDAMRSWGDDRAYRDVLFKLSQVRQELGVLNVSPGRMAALRAGPANMAGQGPSVQGEAQSYIS